MDERSGQAVMEALRDATAEAARARRPTVASVASALRMRVAGPDDPLTALAEALEHSPVGDRNGDGFRRPEAGVFPLWIGALAHAPRPLVAARFADLLWSARYGETPLEWAQRAVDAALASASDQFGHVLEISEGLQRALEISAEIGDRPRHAAVLEALVGLANRSIESDEPSSGIALSIIDFLAGQAVADRPAELGALLELAVDSYRSDPWLLEWALDIKAGLVEPVDRVQLHAAQVDAFAQLARRSNGPLRYAHYEHAIELAARYELSGTAEDLRIELDNPPETPTEPEEPARRGPVDDFMDRIVADDDLASALARFGACLPTESDPAALDDTDKLRLSLFGVLVADLLGRIRARYGSLRGAGAWFECELIGPALAARIAHAVELYEAGDFDASASALAPEVRRVVRLIARAANPSVTPGDDTDATLGAAAGISDVLAALDGVLYEPSRRYLRALLTEPGNAALLVHAACHLRLLRPVEVLRRP